MGDLSEHFSTSEFECNCGCGKVLIDANLVQRLQRLRTQYKRPIRINSGYRCPEYNERIGGVDGSAHTVGKAVDVACEASEERYALLNLVFSYNLFRRVGIHKRFIHLDVDESKPAGVVWLY